MIDKEQIHLMIYQHAMQLTVFASHSPESALAFARKLAALAFDDERGLPLTISRTTNIEPAKSDLSASPT